VLGSIVATNLDGPVRDAMSSGRRDLTMALRRRTSALVARRP
jgi:hypothetical protein